MRAEDKQAAEKEERDRLQKEREAMEGCQATVDHASGTYKGEIRDVGAGGFMLYTPDTVKTHREFGRFFSWDSVKVKAEKREKKKDSGETPKHLEVTALEERKAPNVGWGE